MLSHRLIEQIEAHWEPITAQALNEIQADVHLRHIARLPVSELGEWGRGILKNLGHWLEGQDETLAQRYESVGQLRYREGVPLDEAVHALHIFKHRLLDFIRTQGFAHSTVEIYAEEELEHRVGYFFDWMLWHIVRGYESARAEPVWVKRAGASSST